MKYFSGRQLRKALQEAGLTASALAAKIGVSTSIAYDWVNEKANPVASNLAAMSDALGVSIEFFFVDDVPIVRSSQQAS